MSQISNVVLSDADLEVLALIEQANQQYQVYLELMNLQVALRSEQQPPLEPPRSWDHPLDLVIGKDQYALVERTIAGNRSPA